MTPSIIALAVILIGIGYYYYTTLQSNRNNGTAISMTTINTGDIVLFATGPGTLAPGEEVSFGFKNRGQVSETLVNLGEKVKAGHVLARLESKTLELKYKLAKANFASLSSASGIAAAEQAVQNAQDSLAIARDDLQFLIGPDMLFAEEKVAAAQDELESATASAEKDASEENKQKVADAESTLVKAQEGLTYVFNEYSSSYTLQTFTYPVRNLKGTTIRRQLSAPTDVEISVARDAYELAAINLDDARNYLDVLKGNKTMVEAPARSVASITESKIALDRAKADLDATELVAPISGMVTSINLNVGDNVGTSAVVTISSLNQPYTLDVYLDETDWDKARVGNDAIVTFDLLPNKNFTGKVMEVYPALDSSSGTFLVHILTQLNENINVGLPAGATASVDITGGKALGAILVPISALKEVAPRKYVVYLMKNGKPVEQAVEIGLQSIVNAEVKSGLKPGDVVLTNATANN